MEVTTDIINKVLSNLHSQKEPALKILDIERQRKQIEAELNSASPKDGMMRVIMRMQFQEGNDLGEIDWESELSNFEAIDYPQYYLQPFHSVLGGWLSESASVGNRVAMEAVLENAHPRKSLGLREEIAKLFPKNATTIVDLGGGIGDDAAAIARRLNGSRIIVLEASPFMIIVGRKLHKDISNINWKHNLAEKTDLPDNSIDAVNMTYLLHECPDRIKEAILAECFRILRPGGSLIITDSHPGDLYSYRGFFEPYKEQWLKINPDKILTEAGFVNIKSYQLTSATWTRVCRSPF